MGFRCAGARQDVETARLLIPKTPTSVPEVRKEGGEPSETVSHRDAATPVWHKTAITASCTGIARSIRVAAHAREKWSQANCIFENAQIMQAKVPQRIPREIRLWRYDQSLNLHSAASWRAFSFRCDLNSFITCSGSINGRAISGTMFNHIKAIYPASADHSATS